MMEQSRHRIDNIARQTGFADRDRMRRAFLRAFGHRIGELYAIEERITGKPPDLRRQVRQSEALPLLDNLRTWFTATLQRVSGRSDIAGAIRYAPSRWPALTRFIDDGTLAIDNNAVERAIRPLADPPDPIPNPATDLIVAGFAELATRLGG